MGGEHADFSSQAGHDDAEDPGSDPGEQRAGVDGGGALRHLGADSVEVAAPG